MLIDLGEEVTDQQTVWGLGCVEEDWLIATWQIG
jgi:hypothetical protein